MKFKKTIGEERMNFPSLLHFIKGKLRSHVKSRTDIKHDLKVYVSVCQGDGVHLVRFLCVRIPTAQLVYVTISTRQLKHVILLVRCVEITVSRHISHV